MAQPGRQAAPNAAVLKRAGIGVATTATRPKDLGASGTAGTQPHDPSPGCAPQHGDGSQTKPSGDAEFESILAPPHYAGPWRERPDEPACFGDLNLDQIVAAATGGREEYGLAPIFRAPCRDLGMIVYRQQVFADLRLPGVLDCVNAFAERMHAIRATVAYAGKVQHTYNRKLWLLDAIDAYCDAVAALNRELDALEPRSEGLGGLCRYLDRYVRSDRFQALLSETEALKHDLAGVRYGMLIRGGSVVVRKFAGESDYSARVLATFEKFKRGSVKSYLAEFSDDPSMNHVEAGILERVAWLFPEVFGTLDAYVERHADFVDGTIRRFDRELQFYLGYLQAIAPLERQGLEFCYPRVSDTHEAVSSKEGFDLALALKLTGEGATVVTNDFHLEGPERIIVVSGPNQGGKTTFARAFGQLHYLASLGCPTPGADATLFLFDHLITHFEREENIENLRSKLEDDLVRVHRDLERATSDSILVMNEIFSSTTLKDQVFLSRRVLERIMDLDGFAVCVTFIDELASLSEKTVSMMSTVAPENPATRTFKLVRKPADGLAYARSLAEKRGVTYAQLKERIGP